RRCQRPRVSPRICHRQSKEQRKMNWLKKIRERSREPIQPPTSEEKVTKKTLQIEELEERITPNAIWGD
ncbi:MAG TPA: hypothetical protein VJO72_01870, partial [Candidatus Dormibacteraeota bacterium]|nr:hypothetical protein [Candidatus Dormibacteraeota bacterium]